MGLEPEYRNAVALASVVVAVLFRGDATSVGSGGKPVDIPKVNELDVPPPGAGLNTVTATVPGWVISVAGTEAVSCELLTKEVAKSVLPNRTTELPPVPRMKFVPVAV